MDQATHNKIVSFIWGIADDVLRDLFKRGKYPDVILPMCVIRRMDAVLEPTKKKVLEAKVLLDKAGITEQSAALCDAASQAFYNTSRFTLRDLTSRGNQQQLLADFEEGRLSKVYRADALVDTATIPVARRSIFDGKGYLLTNTVQTTRGCPYDCEFCSVTAFFGRKYRKRPVEAVLAELALMRKRGSYAFFVDDNIVVDRTYSLKLFRGMKGLGLRWLSHASLDLAEDPELLKAIGESGCIGLFVGFESLDEDALRAMGKKTNRVAGYVDAAKAFRDNGIGILGSFVLGLDGDGPGVFEKVLRFCESARIQAGIFPILTPYPGTRVRERLLAEDRILSSDWRNYDMEHVNFRPKGMTAEELQAGYDWLMEHFYSFGSMWRRLSFHRSLPAFGPMNFGFRRALRRKMADA